MIINLSRETLLQPLQKVIGVVERRQAMPILGNVMIRIQGPMIIITGTDSEIELIGQAQSEQDCGMDQTLTLPAHKLMDICRSLPENAKIEILQEKEKERAVLRSGQSRFVLSTQPAEDFPYIEAQSTDISFSLSQKQLKKLLVQTIFAMANQDVRYYLNGLLFEITPQQIRLVATDGHRLSTAVLESTINCDNKHQVIVPRKATLELNRLLTEDEEMVTVMFSKYYLRITCAQWTFTSKLVQGRFPDYKQVFPASGNKVVIVDRAELKDALNRAAILSSEKVKGVRFEFSPGKLHLSTNNAQQETLDEELEVEYGGDPIMLSFNIVYLNEILSVLECEKIQLTFKDMQNSVMIEQPDDKSTLFFLMPMAI